LPGRGEAVDPEFGQVTGAGVQVTPVGQVIDAPAGVGTGVAVCAKAELAVSPDNATADNIETTPLDPTFLFPILPRLR